jgi:two-component system, sensor histidine kinase ChiS
MLARGGALALAPYTSRMSLSRKAAALLFLLLVLLAALAWFGSPEAPRPPKAVAGVLELPRGSAEPIALEGEWGFAWSRFLDPGWDALPANSFAPVPSSWNDLSGKPRGENGWGTYVLRIACPAGQSLAVEAVGQRTTSRLFVNGVQVAAHGEPGASAQASRAAVHSRIPISAEFACPLRLTLHVSNFDHRAGGMVRPLVAGPREALEQRREARVTQGAVLLTAYLLTGAVALMFYGVRRRENVPLLFGLFCIAMAVYSDMIGERLLLRPWGAQVAWAPYMRVEYLSWIAAMALFFLTLRELFPREIHRRTVQVVLAALGLGAMATLGLTPGQYSHVAQPGQAVAVVVAAYIAFGMVRAARRTDVDAKVLLAGMVAVFAALALDLLLFDAPRADTKFAPIGFALFLLSPAVVIARRMSAALNAEERSRTLEENARLREDVERISRHDMKTPLNSILGAARLLGEDRAVTSDQRELVGVLQRAGLRLLEMVNLSLGLYRMETGSYHFQPQAVDLRELVSRVLVDLHSQAEAQQVSLHWPGSSGGGATLVRAEELLCYSIIANVVKNAIEATAAGGQVSVTLVPGDPVQLAVHNPGEVPPEIAARFFDKYVTGRKSGGTGLGTYSAQLMARAQMGDLRMHTGEAGTLVTLTLRAFKDALPAARSTAPREDPQSWLQDLPLRDVLLVDDDEFSRLVTRRLLPSPPFHVDTAPNGQAAMDAMRAHWPDFLLTDMEMPVKDGVETVRWVREQELASGRPRCRIVMMSGNDDEKSAAGALAAGADRFLVKPVSRERLLAALRELELEPRAAQAHDAPAREPVPGGEQVIVNAEWRTVFPGFLQLQQEAAENMARALADGQREALQFVAHRAYGALAAMGLEWASQQSRAVELSAMEGAPAEIAPQIAALREHLARVRVTYR